MTSVKPNSRRSATVSQGELCGDMLAADARRSIPERQPAPPELVAAGSSDARTPYADVTEWADVFVRSRVANVTEPVARPTVEFVVAHVAAITQLTIGELQAHGRSAPVIEARSIAYALCKSICGASSPEIGAFLEREHSSVLNGIGRIARRLETDTRFAARLSDLTALILESHNVHRRRRVADRSVTCPLCASDVAPR